MIGCLPTQALAFLAVLVYATHTMQAIAFEWKPGVSVCFYYSARKLIFIYHPVESRTLIDLSCSISEHVNTLSLWQL